MPRRTTPRSEPEPADALSAAGSAEVSSGSRARRAWWPVAALCALLIAFAATVMSVGHVTFLRSDPKGAYLQATPRLQAIEGITAPVPTATPDPASFAQQIEIILPPPPPPPPPAPAGITLNRADAAQFCANINAQRQAYGLPALSRCYATAARQKHANAMAATFPIEIWHPGDDNIVGVAPSHGALIEAFMNSQGHKDQILYPPYTGARVACAWGKHPDYVPLVYCTADFY